MVSFSDEHVYYEGQFVLRRAHLCIKNLLQILQPLICGVRTSLTIKLHRVVLQKVCRLHSLTASRGSRPKTGATVLFSSNWRRASICYRWASSKATLVAYICCITSCCCSSDAACHYIDVSCCCIMALLCWVIAATIASIALAISGTSPWEDCEVLRGGAIIH